MSDVRVGKGAGSLRPGEMKGCKSKARGGGVMFAMQEQRLMLMDSCDQPIVVEQWGGWLGYSLSGGRDQGDLKPACQPASLTNNESDPLLKAV